MVNYINDGKIVLLVASEGQIGIADPGFQFIQEAIKLKISYTVLPGPSAFMNAYVHSAHILGKFIVQETIHYDIDGIIKGYKDSESSVVFHVWARDVQQLAKSLHEHCIGQPRMITLCCDMTTPDEKIIRDMADNLINNESIKDFKDNNMITGILSHKLMPEQMFF
jgi:16S rRNA C1402 (ribose-2'-O) methylase RsmI